MDAFNKIIASFGSTLKGNPLGSGLGLMGMLSQMSLASKEKSALDRSIWYSKHPEAIASMEQGFEKPLSQGLTKGVGNVVNASMAEQGLSQAPGIQSQVLAQALAPYQQNEQQMALMETFKALGLPAEALQSLKGMNNPNSLALMLKQLLPQKPPVASAPQVPNTNPSAWPGLAPPWGTDIGQPPSGDTGTGVS
jgi:hypothetical protein